MRAGRVRVHAQDHGPPRLVRGLRIDEVRARVSTAGQETACEEEEQGEEKEKEKEREEKEEEEREGERRRDRERV